MALLPLLSLDVFRTGDRGTGILLAARGLGALLGPFLARRFTQNLRSLYAAIGVSFAIYGISYGIVSLSPVLWFAAVFVAFAHLGGGAQWTLSTYGLQRIVPDRIRGRVFSFDFGLATLSFSVSILLGGWIADRVGSVDRDRGSRRGLGGMGDRVDHAHGSDPTRRNVRTEARAGRSLTLATSRPEAVSRPAAASPGAAPEAARRSRPAAPAPTVARSASSISKNGST